MSEFLKKLIAALGMADESTDTKEAVKKIMLGLLGGKYETVDDDVAIDLIKRGYIRRTVDAAVEARKLAEHEREWALKMMAKAEVAAFQSLTEHRNPVVLEIGN